jgi:multidrug efflux pump subunit AcrA (membrane-fusion protein)
VPLLSPNNSTEQESVRIAKSSSGAKPKLLRPIKSKAQLDAAKLNLTYTAVTAAIDGQVQN